MTRTVFRGGTVFDGTGAAPAAADIVVEDGRDRRRRRGLDGDDAVDCTGQTVYPASSTATSTSWPTATSTR